MARPRVHEVAKELGMSSKDVLAHLDKIGQPVKSHSSTIDESLAARVRQELGNGSATATAEPPAGPAEPSVAVSTGADASAEVVPGAPAPDAGVEPATETLPEPLDATGEPTPPGSAPGPAEADTAIDGALVHRGITVQEFAERQRREPVVHYATSAGGRIANATRHD